MSPNSYFLALPLELRRKVYRYLFPVDTYHSEYKGLHLACHQLRSEFDYEALRYLHSLH